MRLSLALARSSLRLDFAYCALLIFFGLLAHAGYGQTHGYISSTSSARLFVVALLQCAGCFVLHAHSTRNYGYNAVANDESPLARIDSERADDKELPQAHHQVTERRSVSWSVIVSGALAALVSLVNIQEVAHSEAQSVFAFHATLPIALTIYTTVLRSPSPLLSWQALMLQVNGILISIVARTGFSEAYRAVPALLGGILLYTYSITVFSHASKVAHNSRVHLTNGFFFLPAALLYGIAMAATGFHYLYPSEWCIPMLIIEAAIGVLSLHVVREVGPVSFSVWTGVSSACLILLTRTIDVTGGMSFLVLFGTSASLWAAWTYLRGDHPEGQHEPIVSRSRLFSSAEAAVVGITVLGLLHTIVSFARSDAEGWPVHAVILPPTQLPLCPRKPLASHGWLRDRPRTFHAFEDVLLVVFFSHARYDANVDFYRDVYAEFFPNVVFVGPASREDAGFAGSYDIFVDSYKSDENLTSYSEFRMAGRMAHHMLYTVMAEHDCYNGYLWAPFDTLLNVPRLLQFDQNRIWYHSPVAADYVPNPALVNTSHHAPPANIGPDPEELHPNWSLMDGTWWWGSPFVGLPVCMPAYYKVEEKQRARLAALTSHLPHPRLIGGSSDTAYIPGRLRVPFLQTLGLFLDTDCFMEIAIPTALHLVLPPNERMQYVDHWWIWQPPFSAEFVRKQWKDDYEVDTFHTFHWGEKNAQGVWTAIPESVQDVRRLQAESARRQGIPWRGIE